MRRAKKQILLPALPLALSAALILGACGGGDDDANEAAQPPPGAVTNTDVVPVPETSGATVPGVIDTGPAPAVGGAAGQAPVTGSTGPGPTTGAEKSPRGGATPPAGKGKAGVKKATASATKGLKSIDSAAKRAENERIAASKGGVTDIGVTKDAITMGTVTMHDIALGNLLATPLVNGIKATMAAVNDRGGVLGRRMSLVDCNDGVGDVARSKACIKKLVEQDKVFALLSYSSWASASVHSDLAQYKLPAVGTWGYSQTEWQDPYMFPTHMSMIHEAIANAQWVKNVIKPKTYGLVCLNSPEMQLSCREVQRVLDASGARLVQKLDIGLVEASLSAQMLAMRAANPEHIVHYVINPATMAKFMVEAARQGYYPPKGVSGNHLATEILGALFGKHPVNRYWTNTTYKLWGAEFMATMNKYARGNKGLNHHIVQASYAGTLIFERAAKAVGPNLTRERLMAQLGNGDVYASDASLDQRFSWTKGERGGSSSDQTWNAEHGQGREFMYKYTSTNTTSDPNGAPSGFQPDPDQFVIYTGK